MKMRQYEFGLYPSKRHSLEKLTRTLLCVSGRGLIAACACFFLASVCAASAGAAELNNGTLTLRLGASGDGVPIIEEGVWTKTGETLFRDIGTLDGLSEWVPEELLLAGKVSFSAWRVIEDENFITGEATAKLSCGLKLTWVVDLSRYESILRLHVRLKNTGTQPTAIEWFPAWAAAWNVPEGGEWVRWWRSLSYRSFDRDLSDERIHMGSELHSSDADDEGVTPFWIIGGGKNWLHFGLEWCGGWAAKIREADGGFRFLVRLPSEETQLVIAPGEAMDGPSLQVTATAGADEMSHRRSWMLQRLQLAQRLYGVPQPSFPLTYNSWYATKFNLTLKFLKRQVAALPGYGFDNFIFDAGWYEHVGDWVPDSEKYDAGEFEQIISAVKGAGPKVGIWSSPQFVTASGSRLPDEVDQPAYYSDFIEGYLLDLAGSDFKTRLTTHVAMLRDNYQADYWKYDQEFFTKKTRAGAMRNVAAFQDALLAVRQQNPDLTIENCQSGGRMLNEFTSLVTQISWLRDSSDNGLEHARQNISGLLGALEFVFPWAAYSFTNNLDRMGQGDDELTRLYCRSAMAGVWGISADLSGIEDRQRAVILKEVENYRRLSEIKRNCLYELKPPSDGSDAAGVNFYDAQRKRAAVLLFRWDRRGAFERRVQLKNLKSYAWYDVSDVDSGTVARVLGKSLMKDGITIPFAGDRQSALVFVEPAK